MLIKATDLVERKNTESYLTNEHIKIISDIYLNYKNVEGRSVIINTSDIPDNKCSISPKLYVKTKDNSDSEDTSVVISCWDAASIRSNNEFVLLEKLLVNENS